MKFCPERKGPFNSLPTGEYWVILHVFLLSADFFQNQLFRKIILGLPSECQTLLDPDQAQRFVEPDLGPNCLQRLSADGTGRQS